MTTELIKVFFEVTRTIAWADEEGVSKGLWN